MVQKEGVYRRMEGHGIGGRVDPAGQGAAEPEGGMADLEGRRLDVSGRRRPPSWSPTGVGRGRGMGMGCGAVRG